MKRKVMLKKIMEVVCVFIFLEHIFTDTNSSFAWKNIRLVRKHQ